MNIVNDFNQRPEGEEMFGLTTTDVIAIIQDSLESCDELHDNIFEPYLRNRL